MNSAAVTSQHVSGAQTAAVTPQHVSGAQTWLPERRPLNRPVTPAGTAHALPTCVRALVTDIVETPY
jgi:hypothetical protein